HLEEPVDVLVEPVIQRDEDQHAEHGHQAGPDDEQAAAELRRLAANARANFAGQNRRAGPWLGGHSVPSRAEASNAGSERSSTRDKEKARRVSAWEPAPRDASCRSTPLGRRFAMASAVTGSARSGNIHAFPSRSHAPCRSPSRNARDASLN